MELGPTRDVGQRPLHPYTEALMSADPLPLPSHLRAQHQRIVLEGEIPSPIHPPSGCRFRTRCASAQPRCAADVPEWRELRQAHWVACHFSTRDGPPPRPPPQTTA
jgi:peptide/nickel transport system ATP-binding protein/oligopeptide transport system ATP-binding protein